MIDLRTRYLGLDLRSPIVASASPLNGDPAMARQVEEAGAGAIVLPSLFEEEILHEELHLTRALEVGAEHFAEIRARIDPDAWREVWALRRIQFPRWGAPRTGPVSATNLLAKRKATLRFLHVHHDDLKHAIELAGLRPGDDVLLRYVGKPGYVDPACGLKDAALDPADPHAKDGIDQRHSPCDLRFGTSTGALGFRKFPNPRFDREAWPCTSTKSMMFPRCFQVCSMANTTSPKCLSPRWSTI